MSFFPFIAVSELQQRCGMQSDQSTNQSTNQINRSIQPAFDPTHPNCAQVPDRTMPSAAALLTEFLNEYPALKLVLVVIGLALLVRNQVDQSKRDHMHRYMTHSLTPRPDQPTPQRDHPAWRWLRYPLLPVAMSGAAYRVKLLLRKGDADAPVSLLGWIEGQLPQEGVAGVLVGVSRWIDSRAGRAHISWSRLSR